MTSMPWKHITIATLIAAVASVILDVYEPQLISYIAATSFGILYLLYVAGGKNPKMPIGVKNEVRY